MNLHAPTRRELLLGSGVLFAWAVSCRSSRAPKAAIRACW